MRLAVLAACPFPLSQGSQVFIAGQARALARAGAEPTLISYGSGQGVAPTGVPLLRAPRAFAPRAYRAGPQWSKPVADAALLATYVRAAWRFRFCASLAHNAEAAVIALAARPLTRIPVVYVAHTALRHELPSYAKARWRTPLSRSGRAIDEWIARRADGVIAVCGETARLLRACARGPLAVIPPGLDCAAAPLDAAQRGACKRLGLVPGSFALYAGNLDGYQDLELLGAAGGHLAPSGPPIVVATHEPRAPSRPDRFLRVVRVESFEEVRALCFAAGVLVLPRRHPGGFPVKLLNYMEAARPIVAYAHIAEGLRHERSAYLLEPSAGPAEVARAILQLMQEATLAERLGQGARAHLRSFHAWPDRARETLAFVKALLSDTVA